MGASLLGLSSSNKTIRHLTLDSNFLVICKMSILLIRRISKKETFAVFVLCRSTRLPGDIIAGLVAGVVALIAPVRPLINKGRAMKLYRACDICIYKYQ